jgi:N-acetylmuramic acid 6-phosphate etherase
MVDVAVTNIKLHDRALRILQDLTDLSPEAADTLLSQSGRSVKVALLMHWAGCDRPRAEQLLATHGGNLRQAIAAASPALS